jgi:hypothetical protein
MEASIKIQIIGHLCYLLEVLAACFSEKLFFPFYYVFMSLLRGVSG